MEQIVITVQLKMESETTAAIVIAIVALLGCIFLCGYVYTNQPKDADLSGIELNINSINLELKNLNKDIIDVRVDLSRDINDIEVDCDCDIDEDDFEDLEDDIRDVWEDMNEEEYECLMESSIIVCDVEYTTLDDNDDGTNEWDDPHTHTVTCSIQPDFDEFEDCLKEI